MVEVNGKLYKIGETEKVHNFTKRTFVVKHNVGGYDQYPTFELYGDHCSLLDSYRKGDIVKVSFTVIGKKWEKDNEEKFFNSLRAYNISIGKEED